ncbi:RAI1-domain-containing protein [Dentipellis sp. KUC8613]|nr:RAI1-domain-containing protein [Dentipellis sp. KUC8613]
MSSRKRSISDLLDGDGQSSQPSTKPRLSSPSQQGVEEVPPNSTLAYPSTSQPSARSVPFQQPLPLLTFSYTPARELEFTNSAMRYYVDPPRAAELGSGYERWVRRPEEKGRLDGLLRAYSKLRKQAQGSAGAIGVVSWRGVMTKILTAPYEERDGWELNVMLHDGTLYFEEHLTDARLQEKANLPAHRLRQTYYGYSFESWCTASEPTAKPGWGGDVDTNVQWCSVVKTKLGDTRMIIGGEVDCVRGKYSGRNDTMVELKTSMNIRGAQDEVRFEKKLLKFYFQSFLLGVPEIVVGFRTPKGQLTTLQSFQTMQIPRMVRGKPHAWDPQLSLEWGDRFLTWLRESISNTAVDPSSAPRVWRVKFVPRVGVDISLLDENGVREVEGGEDRFGFLPRWYWEELQKEKSLRADAQASKPVSHEISQESAHVRSTPQARAPSGWRI